MHVPIRKAKKLKPGSNPVSPLRYRSNSLAGIILSEEKERGG